jgi:signal transduction histidine kinase
VSDQAVEPAPWRVGAWLGVLTALHLFRTVRPLRSVSLPRFVTGLLIEAALVAAAAATTDGWGSPFTFAMITPVVIAGLGRGITLAVTIACFEIVIVAPADALTQETPARTAAQWIVELLLVALVAGYARRILGEGELERSRFLDRNRQLADANALLFSLHRVAQSLPASLDLDEALDTTMSRLRDLFDYDAAALLVLDETDGSWVPARQDGLRLPARVLTDDLPRPLQRTLALRTVISEHNLLASGGPGLAPRLTSGIYTALVARGTTVGLLSLEHAQPNHFRDRDVELVQGFVESAALAVDNARWFGRLRTVGAEEERNRIARDLHDRIGQSLAYLAFELDRIVKSGERNDDVRPALGQLREDVRTVIREVRDTLYDLRTDVSEEQGFLRTLELFVDRVRERSLVEITLRTHERVRLPLPQERELFRIAQEAVVNVERHADAHHITITWSSEEGRARLDVADDGRGFPIGRAGRLDSYGLLGMRERAASIGASLVVESEPGHGTRIRCDLPADPRARS